MKHPFIIGHRGGATLWPENTLAAFRNSFQEGADGIETDIQLTSDKKFICWHDTDFSRIGYPHLEPGQLNLEEVNKLNVGLIFGPTTDHMPPPSLRDLLSEFGHYDGKIFLELKTYEEQKTTPSKRTYIQQLIHELDQYAGRCKLILISFDIELLKCCESMKVCLPLMYLWPEEQMDSKEQNLDFDFLYGIGFDISNPPLFKLQNLPAHQKKLCYTCLNHDHYQKATELEVDFLMCDNPVEALNWRRQYENSQY
jgi:glycerophosphoryl diester phosphodiesterase